MIELHTGGNGAGKTCEIVSRLSKITDRPLFIFGIPELKIPHEKTPPISEWTKLEPHPEDPSLLIPTFTFPAGAIVVIDEAQNVYRPRGTGTKVPDIVAAFEAHRSLGIDFWLITQHPGLIDSNVRKLVRRHVHYRPTPLGRYAYEWPEANDPEKRSTAVKRKYSLDKKAFKLYKSAEQHTKLEHKKPLAMFVLAAVILGGSYLGYRLYDRFNNVNSPNPAEPVATPAQPEARGAAPGSPDSRVYHLADFQSPVPGHPEYAPAYDEIRKPKYMPIVSGCVESSSSCRCYSQQGTAIDDVSLDQCRVFVKKGSFNPYDSAILVASPPPQLSVPPQVKEQPETNLIEPVTQPPFSSMPHEI